MKTVVAFIALASLVAAQEYPVGVIPGSPEDLAARKPAFRSQITDLTRIGCKLRPDLGSGVNTEYGVITCWHCVSSGKPIEVECDGEIGRGTVIAKDEAADVALIAVPWARSHPIVWIASDARAGSLSLVARSPSGSIAVQSAEVTGKSFDGMVLVSPPTVAGQSGGGYIDAAGDLAGIVSGNVIDREPFRGLMIPASAIRRILPANAARQSTASEAAPTPYSEVDRVLSLMPKPSRKFVEFGCGADARWCVAAAHKWRCPAIGIEIDPTRARLARERVRQEGLDHLIEIHQGDATAYEYSSSDVGACYLYSETVSKLIPKVRHFRAFASYMHEPAGLGATRNGDSWIYVRPAQQQTAPMVNYGGQLYSGRVCSDPRCGMCAAIQSGLAQVQQQQPSVAAASASPRGHYERRKVCTNGYCRIENVWVQD